MHSTLSILSAVGQTPLVQLRKIVPAGTANVFVKLEYFNPTGSYKDRMALAIIEHAEKRGDLRPGMTVVEATGGSTGTSLAFVCALKGYRFRVVSSDAFTMEKRQSMRLFGAELELIPSQGGRITPDLIPSMIKRAKEITQEENGWWVNQFDNKDAIEGYRALGREVVAQLEAFDPGATIDAFCSAVGTGGMLTGVAREVRQKGRTRIIALEPASAPLLSTGTKGSHTVDGIGIGFIPPLLDRNEFDEVRAIEESGARPMARRLAAEEGIFTGTSSGLNVVAALEIARELGPGHNVVTVAVDSGMKYLAGGLFE